MNVELHFPIPVLIDDSTLVKRKREKLINVTVGRMVEILLKYGTRFEPSGSEILWPGGHKTFKTHEVSEFLSQKKGRTKKSKSVAEKVVGNWKGQSSTLGFGKGSQVIINSQISLL